MPVGVLSDGARSEGVSSERARLAGASSDDVPSASARPVGASSGRVSRIAVVGAGANGAAIAADLVRGGHDVEIIDPWAANVDAIRRRGVEVERAGGVVSTTVTAHHVSDVATLRVPYDIVFVGVKAYDTRWAVELVRPLVAADGVVVGVQNGMTVPQIEAVVGPDRTLGCVIEVAAEMFVPGRVRQQTPMWFAVGAVGAVGAASAVDAAGAVGAAAARRLERVVPVLASAGTVTVSDDIVSSKWMKLVANAAELVTSAVLDLPLADAVRVDGMHDVMREAGAEAARVAIAGGRRLVPVFDVDVPQGRTPEGYAADLLDGVLGSYTLPDTLTTVLQDWRKGRRAEIEELNGHVVREGARLGIPTPVNERVLAVARRVEAGVLAASPENASLLCGDRGDDGARGQRGGGV